MIIKDFGLDMPELQKELKVAFRNETRCVLSLFERFLGKYKTKDCWRIWVNCVNEISDNRILNLLGVYNVQIVVDTDTYFKMSAIDKKKAILNYLWQGILQVVNDQDWELDIFNAAYSKVIELNFSNEWVWKKKAISPNKEYKAIIFCIHEIYLFEARLRILDKKSNIVYDNTLFTDTPDEFIFSNYFGEFKWESNNVITLGEKIGNGKLEINLNGIVNCH